MKHFYFFICCLFSFPIFAQVNGAYLNLDQKNIIHKSRSNAGVSWSFRTNYRKDTISGFSLKVFDELGRTKLEYNFKPDSSLRSAVLNYFDDRGAKFAKFNFNTEGLVNSESYYGNYQGQGIESVQKKPDGTFQLRSVYLFSEEGLKTNYLSYSDKGERVFTTKIESYGGYPSTVEMRHFAGMILLYSDSYYNDNGQIAKKESKFGNAKKFTTEVFIYDENQLLIRSFSKKEGKVISKSEHQYFKSEFKTGLKEMGFEADLEAFISEKQNPKKYIIDSGERFPGGSKALSKYLNQESKYHKKANSMDVHGIVLVRFELNEEGKAINVGIEKSLHKKMDKGAKKIIRKMPSWKANSEKEESKEKAVFYLPIQF